MTQFCIAQGPAPCWDAWMRGSAGLTVDSIAGEFPDLGPAADALERRGMAAFSVEAGRAVRSSEDSSEVSFLAYLMAIRWIADCSADGIPYGGGLARFAEAVFGKGSENGILSRALGDLPGMMRPGSPEGLCASADSLLELTAECFGSSSDLAEASRAGSLLSRAADSLVASCIRLEPVDGFSAALERVSLVALFGRMLAKAAAMDGRTVPSGNAVRAMAACQPTRWTDGTSVVLEGLFGCMCSAAGCMAGAAPIGVDGMYIDMSGCPGI